MKTKIVIGAIAASLVLGFGSVKFYTWQQVQMKEREAVCKTLQAQFGKSMSNINTFENFGKEIYESELATQSSDKSYYKDIPNLPLLLSVRKELVKRHDEFPKGMSVSMVNSAGLLDVQYNDAWKNGAALAENLGYAICLDI